MHSNPRKPIRLAISPCPNDTFAFYALLKGKTDFHGEISCEYLDIEALNQACASQNYDFCKVSFFAFLNRLKTYFMLDSGAALGFGCGPLIVGKGPGRMKQSRSMTIAIPGIQTTANLLLNLYSKQIPNLTLNTRCMPFHTIMRAVNDGEVDAGLIIHESRFTFKNYGLNEWIDLGTWWEKTSGRAIPLGGIAARRNLSPQTITDFQEALKQSITYAWNHLDEVTAFMKCHAQEMDVAVMMQHVNLYVNPFTLSLGKTGRESIYFLWQATKRAGFLPEVSDPQLFEP